MTKLVFVANTTSAVTETTYDGKPYLIAPVVMLREGVHNRLLYLTEELGAFADAWNGRPVSLGHPKRNGEYVSANTVDIWATEVPGQVWNVTVEQDRLVAEIWIDLEKAAKIGEPATKVIDALRAGESMEVSTGLLLNVEEVTGNWNGESYDGIARMIYPDHLALLPNEIGACSWEDGCGTPRINQKGEGMGDEVTANELTLDDKATLVRRAFWDTIYTVDQSSPIYGDWDVVSVFDTTLIAKNWNKKSHMAFPYTMTEAGEVAFGDATAVEVVYRATDGGAEVVVANQETPAEKMPLWNRFRQWLAGGVTEDAGEAGQPAVNQQEDADVKKCDLVAALVANKQCQVPEAALQQMDEATLAALHASFVPPAEAAPAATPVAPVTPAAPVVNTQGVDAKALVEMVKAAVNEAVGPVLQTMQANADRERGELVAEIVANSDMGEEDLKPMTVDALRKLAANLQPRDYGLGMGTFRANDNADEEYVLAMPQVWPVAGEGK